ncbi:MAG: hypothetical protein AB199_03515 [Parcubacteria bacterium C7867-004]|nr:MAG: hypothetical protein AB199_03515 [Parcubacteria bacterium C7867-004]
MWLDGFFKTEEVIPKTAKLIFAEKVLGYTRPMSAGPHKRKLLKWVYVSFLLATPIFIIIILPPPVEQELPGPTNRPSGEGILAGKIRFSALGKT